MRVFASLASLGLTALGGATALFFGVVPAMSQPAGGTPAIIVAGSQQLKPYRINPGDDLDINVWGEERLQREAKVLPDGTFTFPLVGQIAAVNRLPSEVAADITTGLKTQYRDNVPTVTVSVKGATGLQFSVAGKVKGPGAFTPGRYVNVVEAIIMAGGAADFANVDDVTILRKSGSGQLTSIKVRLGSIFKGNPSARDMANVPELESGDTVIVP